LVNIAVKKTSSLEVAKECVQDVFLSLYYRKNNLNTTSSLKAYLYKALQNKIYNHYHQQLTRQVHEQAAVILQPAIDDIAGKSVEYIELEQNLQQKIHQLPAKCQKVFLLSREEGLSYKEIAEQLNISVNTVEQHMQKALRILRNFVYRLIILIPLIKWL
jgi:RNA polymerase sigma-70 factor (ECF subfamily)